MTIIFHGDCRDALKIIPDGTIQTCVTSPPYFGLRDYGHAGQIGLEPTPDEFVAAMVEVFRDVRRCLRDDGTLWLNLGDSYAGSWGAQSRKDTVESETSTISGKSMLSARQIKAHPKGQTHTGSLKNTPGLKNKDLIGIPWRVAFALQADGWYLRQDIIWHKPNPMPESVTDRCTKAHEYIFLMSKSPRYYFDADAIKEKSNGWKIGGAKTRGETGYAAASGAGRAPQRDSHGGLGGDGETRNRRSVWTVTTKPYKGAHFATFPPTLIEPCILAGAPVGGLVLDPFLGSGTTAAVARQHGREGWGCELNPEYIELAKARIGGDIIVVPV